MQVFTFGWDSRRTLTAEGYDVAAVGVHKFPRHRLLHDLLHLRDQGERRETSLSVWVA